MFALMVLNHLVLIKFSAFSSFKSTGAPVLVWGSSISFLYFTCILFNEVKNLDCNSISNSISSSTGVSAFNFCKSWSKEALNFASFFSISTISSKVVVGESLYNKDLIVSL